MEKNRDLLLYIARYKGWDFVCKEFHDKMSDPFIIEFMPYIDIDLIASKREIPKYIVDRFKHHKTKGLDKIYDIIEEKKEDSSIINKLINTYIGTLPHEMEFEGFMDKIYLGIRESVIQFQKEEIKKYYSATAIHYKKKYLEDDEALTISRLVLEIKEYVKNPRLSKHDVIKYLEELKKAEKIMFYSECYDYPCREDESMTYLTFSITPKDQMMNYFIIANVKKK